MHRFFLTDTPIQPGAPVDLTPIVHQVRAVLRLGVGDHVVLLDNRGGAFLAEIRALDRKSAQGFVLEEVTVAGEPTVAVTLFQCSLKADKFEWVLQKGTELGVTRFVPVVSRRSVVRPVALPWPRRPNAGRPSSARRRSSADGGGCRCWPIPWSLLRRCPLLKPTRPAFCPGKRRQ